MSETALQAQIDALRLGGGVAVPTGPAGLDLTGTYPNPGVRGSSYSSQNKEGASILAGAPVAVHTSGVGIVKASAANTAKPAIGLLRANTLDTFAGAAQTSGVFDLSDWTSITGTALLVRALYYLDPTTPGKLTTVAPSVVGQIVQPIGFAISTTQLDLMIASYLLL